MAKVVELAGGSQGVLPSPISPSPTSPSPPPL